MEIETPMVDVYSFVSNLAINTESTNTISIYVHHMIEEVIEDESGVLTQVESRLAPFPPYHITLKPLSLTSRCLSQLLDDHEVPCFEYIGEELTRGIYRSLLNDPSLREPLFVTVKVKFIEEMRLVLPPQPTPSRSASWEVFRRLKEEHRVESSNDLKEEDKTCSICIENLLETDGNMIIQMPGCLHMFHQDCLFEWLGRQNSCPLCRKVPFEKGQETE